MLMNNELSYYYSMQHWKDLMLIKLMTSKILMVTWSVIIIIVHLLKFHSAVTYTVWFLLTVIVEALKCLCNLAYNCSKVQSICSCNGTLDGIIRRLRMHPDANLPHQIKFFDVKLLFLISALSANVRYAVLINTVVLSTIILNLIFFIVIAFTDHDWEKNCML